MNDGTGADRNPLIDPETSGRAFDMFGSGSDEDKDEFRSLLEAAAGSYRSHGGAGPSS